MKVLMLFLMSNVALSVALQSARTFINDAISKSVAKGNLTIPQDPDTLSTFADIIAASNITLDNDLTIHANISSDSELLNPDVRWNYMCLLDNFRGFCHYYFLDNKKDNKQVKNWLGFDFTQKAIGSWKNKACSTRLIAYTGNDKKPTLSAIVIGNHPWTTIPKPWDENTGAYISWW